MGVELIHDKDPWCLWIGSNGLRNMRGKIFFGSCRPNGGRHDFPCRHVEMGDQALRPMTNVFLLGALDQATLHGQRGRGALQGLDPRLLICADDVAPLLSEGLCLLVHLTHCRHFVGKHLGIIGLRVEPVFDPMRLHIGLILKNARRCGC